MKGKKLLAVLIAFVFGAFELFFCAVVIFLLWCGCILVKEAFHPDLFKGNLRGYIIGAVALLIFLIGWGFIFWRSLKVAALMYKWLREDVWAMGSRQDHLKAASKGVRND